MGRVITPDSEEGKELLKHEQWPAHWNGTTYQPGNPYVYRAYPRMLYRAVKKENGKVVCMEPAPQPDFFEKQHEFDRAIRLNDALNKSCQKMVDSEAAHLLAKGQGWCDTASEALEQFEKEQIAIGDAAAMRHFTDKRMTPRAQAEAHAIDEAASDHVADVPAPKLKPKPRGRPPGRKRKPNASPVSAEAQGE